MSIASSSYCHDVGVVLQFLAVQMAEPFWRSTEVIAGSCITPIKPGEYGQCECVVIEIFKRAIYTLAAALLIPFTACLAALGMAVHCISNQLLEEPYLYLRSDAPEKTENEEQDTLLTLNACMFPGCLPMLFGGVSPARTRTEALAQLIHEVDPDTFCLQEVSAPAAYQLYDLLKDRYAHFYFNMGMRPFWLESSLFCATKRPVTGKPAFLNYQIENMQKGMSRGLFYFETQMSRLLTTHLQPHNGEEYEAIRRLQLQCAIQAIDILQAENPKYSFLLGDLNIARLNADGKDEYTLSGIKEYFNDPYLRKYPFLTPESATCKDNDTFELIDYSLLAKCSNPPELEVLPIDTMSLNNPQKALSDHRGLLLKVRYPEVRV